MGTNMDLFAQSSQVDLQSSDLSSFPSFPFRFLIAYHPHDTESRLRLKRPKRTMSAYSCYSRSVYLIPSLLHSS